MRAEYRQPSSDLPSIEALVALGPVLSLYRSGHGDELGGWARAISAHVSCRIDSDGWYECVQFRDRVGDCCWRLYLLPDSDFWAWQRLQSEIPIVESRTPLIGTVASRLWHRVSARVGGDRWLSGVVRLHAPRDSHRALVASPVPISPLGVDVVRRVERIEGLDAVSFDGDRRSHPRAAVEGGWRAQWLHQPETPL